MTTKTKLPHVNAIAFGVVKDYPPAHWKYGGYFKGGYLLYHEKPPAQSTPYPDQVVSREVLDRLFAQHSEDTEA